MYTNMYALHGMSSPNQEKWLYLEEGLSERAEVKWRNFDEHSRLEIVATDDENMAMWRLIWSILVM